MDTSLWLNGLPCLNKGYFTLLFNVTKVFTKDVYTVDYFFKFIVLIILNNYQVIHNSILFTILILHN